MNIQVQHTVYYKLFLHYKRKKIDRKKLFGILVKYIGFCDFNSDAIKSNEEAIKIINAYLKVGMMYGGKMGFKIDYQMESVSQFLNKIRNLKYDFDFSMKDVKPIFNDPITYGCARGKNFKNNGTGLENFTKFFDKYKYTPPVAPTTLF